MWKQMGILKRSVQLIPRNERLVHISAIRKGVTSADGKGQVAACYAKNQALYKQYQVDDGVPVHLKRGFRDYALYYFTIGLIVIGVGESLHFIYTSAFPKKA